MTKWMKIKLGLERGKFKNGRPLKMRSSYLHNYNLSSETSEIREGKDYIVPD